MKEKYEEGFLPSVKSSRGYIRRSRELEPARCRRTKVKTGRLVARRSCTPSAEWKSRSCEQVKTTGGAKHATHQRDLVARNLCGLITFAMKQPLPAALGRVTHHAPNLSSGLTDGVYTSLWTRRHERLELRVAKWGRRHQPVSQLISWVFDPQPLSESPQRSLDNCAHLSRPGKKFTSEGQAADISGQRDALLFVNIRVSDGSDSVLEHVQTSLFTISSLLKWGQAYQQRPLKLFCYWGLQVALVKIPETDKCKNWLYLVTCILFILIRSTYALWYRNVVCSCPWHSIMYTCIILAFQSLLDIFSKK